MEADESIKVQGKNFHCSLCDVKIANEKSVEDHLKGKKHQRLSDLKKCRQEQADHSVFVGGLHKLMSELALTDHFMQFGSVSKVIVDKDKGKFAIVEFTEKESVMKAAKQEKQTLHGCKMTVRPREQKKFSIRTKGAKGGAGDTSPGYGTIPSDLQKAIVMRLTPVEHISDQMKELVSLLELPPSGLRLRYLICTLLREVFKEFFPACQVVPFGSTVNGFGVLGCDLDLHLEPRAAGFNYKFAMSNQDESMEDNSDEDDEDEDEEEDLEIDLDKASAKDVMELVCKVLRQCVPSCQNIKAILHARRPVVKFQHKDSKLNGDISMNNRLAMRNTELLHYFTTLDDRIRPLVYTIRHWAKARHLAGNPGAGPRLTNYALSLMVVYYLQMRSPAILPTVEQLREGKDSSDAEVIEGWDCSFSTDGWTTTNTESLVDLLREFFHFYSTFDFTTTVICVQKGTAHPISTFVAPESPVYEGRVFRLNAINVQDPFELSHNVAYNVNEKVVHNLRKEVKKAYTLCLSNKFKRKKPSSSTEAEGYLGLPVIFDAANYDSASAAGGGKKERKGSTSTEGSVTGDGKSVHSFNVSMKASNLSDAFVKAHNNSHDLRMAWCNATTTLIKHILHDVLLIQCEERTSDEGHAVKNVDVDGTSLEGSSIDQSKIETDASPSTDKKSPIEGLAEPKSDHGNGHSEAAAARKHVLRDDGDGDLPAKRPKLMEDELSKQTEDAMEEDEEACTIQQTDMTDKPNLICSASHQVWIGRRKVRRHLNQTNPQPVESHQLSNEERLSMEAIVSKHIISQDMDSGNSSSPKPLTKFKLFLEESDNSGESSMKLVFQPTEGLEPFKMLFQFLQTFLVKYIDQNKV